MSLLTAYSSQDITQNSADITSDSHAPRRQLDCVSSCGFSLMPTCGVSSCGFWAGRRPPLGLSEAEPRVISGGWQQRRPAGMKVKAKIYSYRILCETYSRYSTCISKINSNYRTTELNYCMSTGRRFSTVFPDADAWMLFCNVHAAI